MEPGAPVAQTPPEQLLPPLSKAPAEGATGAIIEPTPASVAEVPEIELLDGLWNRDDGKHVGCIIDGTLAWQEGYTGEHSTSSLVMTGPGTITMQFNGTVHTGIFQAGPAASIKWSDGELWLRTVPEANLPDTPVTSSTSHMTTQGAMTTSTSSSNDLPTGADESSPVGLTAPSGDRIETANPHAAVTAADSTHSRAEAPKTVDSCSVITSASGAADKMETASSAGTTASVVPALSSGCPGGVDDVSGEADLMTAAAEHDPSSSLAGDVD